jgi:SAM-dependent methyltransferase
VDRSANAVTLETYGQAMDRWREASCEEVAGAHLAFLEQVCALLPTGGQVLEVGSGSGRDAAWFEAHGLVVRRTDGCPAFVEALRAAGHAADLLDLLHDQVPGGYDLVYANAVLLHLEAADLPGVLTRLATAAPLVAFTLKVGEGAQWSTAKTGLPRFFQYWDEAALREALARTPWRVRSLDQRRGRYDDWLQVVCER